MGLRQGVIPPLFRPELSVLKRVGFVGSETEIISKAMEDAPVLLRACFSASSMWTANAATVSPSTDSSDGRVHFTPANLVSKVHRSLEANDTFRILKGIFSDEKYFQVHSPLPSHPALGDEGAANHTRFCSQYSQTGLQFFVYGTTGREGDPAPRRFPARQTLDASQAIARLHQLKSENVVFAQQNPEAIDAGVFHNDVIAVGNQDVLFYHSEAFLNEQAVIEELNQKYSKISGKELRFVRVRNEDVQLSDVVRSYLFNSQLLSLPDGQSMLLAPIECFETPSVKAYLDQIADRSKGAISKVEYVDLRQSMQNGGGPACLRLRTVLNEDELAKMNDGVLLDASVYAKIKAWVEKHYRDRLEYNDFKDAKLLEEVRTALDELTQILRVGSIYPFQL